jgi:flagellin-like hook-associated protein FlgL
LVRDGFAEAGYADVTAALRNDVTDTLQAAIADPGVAARLGRLTKAERWSGFGDFGDAPTVVAAGPEPDLLTARARAETAAAVVAAAQASRSEALDLVAERRAKLTTARRRYEQLLESVSAAEQALNTADADLGAAERAATVATERLDAATSELALAESDGHSAAK